MAEATSPQHILIVDDDVHLARALGRLVEGEGRVVELAHDVASGARALSERAIDVLICDYDLPDGRGDQVLAVAREVQPDAPRILLTGHAEWEVAQQAINAGEILRALQKPCDASTLRGAVDEALRLKIQRDGRRELRMMADGYTRELVAVNDRLRREHDALMVELERCRLETVAALVSAAEQRREGVRERARAVSAATARLGAALGVDPVSARDLQLASMLQEVGIVGLSDRELAAHEGGQSELHLRIAEASAAIVARVSHLQGAARILKEQHAPYDSHDLPLTARILAAAARFRELLDHGSVESARTELVLEAGARLDPLVVSTLLSLESGSLH